MSDTIHTYQTAQTCTDKSGQPVDQLVIDLDRAGIFGEIMQHGHPITLADDGSAVENKTLLKHYLNFAANIDLTDVANLKSIGMGPLGKARLLIHAHWESTAGISYIERRSDGKMSRLVDPDAANRTKAPIGHLLNPLIAGQSLESVERMNFAKAEAVLEAVGISNTLIAKNQDD